MSDINLKAEIVNEKLRKLPGVDKLLNQSEILKLTNKYGVDLVTYSIRQVLGRSREKGLSDDVLIETDEIIEEVQFLINSIEERILKPMINATGIVLHTNLGRAPLGKAVFSELEPIITSYSNLEFDLQSAKRGNRNTHISEIIKYIIQAEDALVVNNNAAGIFLALKAFAEGKEVIISRGELVEIGDSFRIPDIITASGAKIVEVGTTNRTRLSDYENAITENTRIIFKAHKSNYQIVGFTEEVGIKELRKLAKKYNLILLYDIGSGYMRKIAGLGLEKEPDVCTSLHDGADIVTFSCDKLLGGPQAGIIAGRKHLIHNLARNPLMRTLRVDKLTISALEIVLKCYLKRCISKLLLS